MGQIYVYTGTGGGKTTNALGLALRTVGHEKTVVVVQFLKWKKDTGEYLIQEKLKPYYRVYQFGRKTWLGEEEQTYTCDGQTFKIKKIGEADARIAKEGLEFVKRIMLEKPHLLILDEINLALYWKLLDTRDVLELLDAASEETTLVLTGRFAPEEIIKRADFVNEIKEIKVSKDFKTTEGIHF